MKKSLFSKQNILFVLKICGITLGIIGAVVLAVAVLVPLPIYKTGFETLTAISEYAQGLEEKVPTDTDNTIRPQFNKHYKQFESSFWKNSKKKFSWLFSFIGLSKPPLWSAGFFKEQLEKLTKPREEKGMKDNFVTKIATTSKTKFVIFGNVQGAFHSIVRDLEQLKKLDFIDDDLKLKSSDYYIVFMGDVISRSHSTMQMLSLAMRLLQANPDNVVYLRGNHETGDYWQEHSLKAELQIRAKHLDESTIPLEKEVTAFFNTLALACYITTIDQATNEFIRISDSKRGKIPILNEAHYAAFLSEKKPGLSWHQLKGDADEGGESSEEEGPEAESSIDLKVIFKGEKKRESFQTMTGLRYLSPDMGAVAWNILSCPTMVYQKALKFYHDAFVMLIPAAKLEQWQLILYNRDTRQDDKEYKKTVYSLLTGVEEGTQTKAPTDEPAPDAQAKEEEKTDKPEKKAVKAKPKKIKQDVAQKQEEAEVRAKKQLQPEQPQKPTKTVKRIPQQPAEPSPDTHESIDEIKDHLQSVIRLLNDLKTDDEQQPQDQPAQQQTRQEPEIDDEHVYHEEHAQEQRLQPPTTDQETEYSHVEQQDIPEQEQRLQPAE
ncbi:MAG: metallophosphoesterase [Epsilonproteobacteria bacterium]|nr:metallophosphoesterase [Campylobacterota bacterium]